MNTEAIMGTHTHTPDLRCCFATALSGQPSLSERQEVATTTFAVCCLLPAVGDAVAANEITAAAASAGIDAAFPTICG